MGPLLTALAWLSSALAGMPVRSVRYEVDVDGPLAEVHISQVFVNDKPETIEAIYVFPLHEDAAVDGMRMIVGDRLIEGEVLELQQAEAEYTQAIEEGYTAALTTQQRPNVFTQKIGNIGPGEEVTVELRVVQPVPRVDGAYELVLPLVVAPRFLYPEEWVQSLDRPTLFTEPPVAVGGASIRAHIDVEIDSGLPFEFMQSPSHEMVFTEISEGARAVTGEVPLDRDFVLRWNLYTREPASVVHVQDGHLLLAIEPPDLAPRERLVPREYIFVVDQSCSMSGTPIDLARSGMLSLLDSVDERDSVRLLRFSSVVAGDDRSRPATADVLDELRREIEKLDTHGGTYLLDGVLAALETPPDPQRERVVVFLTDGLVSNDNNVLAAIADRVGSARLFAFGIGAAPNRWLLDEMSDIGGGKTSWMREGEVPEEAVERFVETIASPVLTDISIQWNDWVVEETFPARFPALHAGQPLLITARIVDAGELPIRVSGRLGDGQYTAWLSPVDAGPGRAIPSTWARQKIASLQRELLWGPLSDLEDEIVKTSVSYQVLSEHTAFLAVDRGRIVQPGGTEHTEEQSLDLPAGMDLSSNVYEEITVSAKQSAVNTASTTHGHVLQRDFLQRIPAGRTYQSAVQTVPGASGAVGGNPNMAGALANESTYLLDGANITDPVTGTFSLNFNYDAIEQIDVILGGRMPEIPGSTGSVISVMSQSGTNNLEAAVRVDHTSGLSPDLRLGGEGVSGQISGPILRDKLWALGSYELQQSALRGEEPREFLGHTGFLKLTAQPNPEHRFSVSGAAERSNVALPEGETPQDSALGIGRWQWFLSPDVSTEVLLSGQQQHVASDLRSRLGAQASTSVVSVEDPLGSVHDLKFGLGIDRTRWSLGGSWAEQWLGLELPEDTGALSVSAFAQDSVRLVRNLVLNSGVRVDAALGRAHVGPRLYAAWDPWGDQRTKLATGFGRMYGQLTLPVMAIAPEEGLPQLDEWLVLAEREIVEDLALGLELVHRNRFDLPVYGGGRADQTSWGSRLFLRKIESRRWSALLSWRYTDLLWGQEALWLEDGTPLGFRHAADGSLSWALPTDPYTLSLGLIGGYYAGPLGTFILDPSGSTAPATSRWNAGLRLSQAIDTRKGRLVLDAELLYLGILDDPRDLSGWAWVQAPTLQQQGWGGPQLQIGANYSF